MSADPAPKAPPLFAEWKVGRWRLTCSIGQRWVWVWTAGPDSPAVRDHGYATTREQAVQDAERWVSDR